MASLSEGLTRQRLKRLVTRNGIVISKSNKHWFRLKKYKSASTECIIVVMQDLKDRAIRMLKDVTCDRNIIIDAALKCFGDMDLKHLDMTHKRAKVEQYILKSYPYWSNISANNPQLSVNLLIDHIKDEFPDYISLLDTLCEDYVEKLTKDDIDVICMLTQKLIAYSIFYVHEKRFPKDSGVKNYRKPGYCEVVDLNKWSRSYSLELT